MSQSANPPKVMIVAGEASGEQYGAWLAEALRALCPGEDLELFGAGGKAMARAGVELVVDTTELAVVGLVEVLSRIGRYLRARDALVNAAEQRRPDVIVLIDWPDFNFRLAKKLHRRGLRTVYYVVPQVWGSRSWRARALARDFERLFVILPFEADYYRERGIAVQFVGHPVLDLVRATLNRNQFRERYQLDPQRRIVSLLPGSRGREVNWNLPCQLAAAESMSDRSDLQFVLAIAPGISVDLVTAVAKQNRKLFLQPLQSLDGRPFFRMHFGNQSATIVVDDTYNALAHSEIAILASGTAALEAAILGTPAIVMYNTTPLNWEIFRPLVNVGRISLVNLIAGHDVIPELLQSECAGPKIAECATTLLDSPEKLASIREELGGVVRQLGNTGASQTAARAILELLSQASAAAH